MTFSGFHTVEEISFWSFADFLRFPRLKRKFVQKHKENQEIHFKEFIF